MISADNIEGLLRVAMVLSGLTLVVFLGVILSLWRRESVPSFTYGGVTLTQNRIRWVWFFFLIGAFATGVAGDVVVQSTSTFEDPVDPSGEPWSGAVVGSSVVLPLPFYRYERESRKVGGHLVEESVLRGVVIPWSLFGALLAYLVLVVRWNPDSRWARRILEGKRRKRWFR